jgi:ketosteroid isomerase-like protein
VAAGEQVIRRAYDALNRRDYELMAELADPDFEMDLTERVMNPASYHGAEGMQRFLREIDELWTSMEIRVERVLERGDEALAVVLVTLQGRGSGVALENRISQWWTLRDGKLLTMRLQADADAALREFEAGAH